jgi:hypothetical protein
MIQRRAISAYIATLFLVGLAVAGGVLLYSTMLGSLSDINTNELPQTLSLDTANIVNSTTCIAYVRNVGSKPVIIDSAYIDDEPVTDVDAVTIGPDELSTVKIRGSFVSGTSYDFKIVAKDLTKLMFTSKASF